MPSLQTAVDVVVAPRTAFDRLAEHPAWVWTFALVCAVAGIASFAMVPATIHAMTAQLQTQLASDPQMASLPAEKRTAVTAQAIGLGTATAKFGFVFVPISVLLIALVQGAILLALNAIVRGGGSFRKFWSLSIHVAVVGVALSGSVLAAIVLIRGSDSFTSSLDLQRALPSLALLAPGAPKLLSGFLAGCTIFNIWAAVLIGLGTVVMARFSRNAAIAAGCIMLLGSGLAGMLGVLSAR